MSEKHKPDCGGIGGTVVRVEMPKVGKYMLSCRNYHKQMAVPYVIYADLDSLTTKMVGPELYPIKSNTQKTQLQESCSYSYKVVRCVF